MHYGLHDKPPAGVTLLSAIQWLIVTLSSTVVVPLVVGDVYGLHPEEIGSFMQQTIFFVGLASFLQVWCGHRYPVMEAPAGLWWGIFLILAQIGISVGTDPRAIGQAFQLGMIMAGVLFLILGATGWIARIQKWFTPSVTGTYMVLLSVSLCSNFIKGMLGVGYQQSQAVQPKIAILSVIIIALVILFMKIRYISSFAVLLGMLAGWITYGVLGWAEPVRPATTLISWPSLFFWGPPRWDSGIILTSLLTGFVLLTNLITSLVVVGNTVREIPTRERYNRGGVFTGVTHILSGLSGVVGMIPLSLAAAVIKTTNIASRLPFMVAMAAMMVIGILPSISLFLASMPTPVAYAAMFVTFTQLLGFGLRDFAGMKLDERAIIIVGGSLLVGIGIMFVPAGAWQSMHPLVSYLFGNGLLLGVLVCLFLEHVIFRKKEDLQQKGGHAS